MYRCHIDFSCLVCNSCQAKNFSRREIGRVLNNQRVFCQLSMGGHRSRSFMRHHLCLAFCGYSYLYSSISVSTIFHVFCISLKYIHSYFRIWAQSRPRIIPIFLSASSFQLACAFRDKDTYSFLQQIRFCPLSRSRFDCKGSKRADFVSQESWWMVQNWPIVFIHLPKALISAA